MKRFLRKRWHGLPVGIITAGLLVCLLAGSVLAAYNFLDYTADVTVEEAIGIQFTADDEGVTWDGNTITVADLYPGSWKCGYFAFTNISMSDLKVTINVTPDPAVYDIDMWIQGHDIGHDPNDPPYPALDGFFFTVPAGTTSYTIEGGPHLITCVIVEAGAETPAVDYSFTIAFSRSAAN